MRRRKPRTPPTTKRRPRPPRSRPTPGPTTAGTSPARTRRNPVSRGEPLRVVCYAVNGTGVGHITRLLAIARWLRRYAAALDRRLEIWFLTSSEADGLVFAEGFAAFKIPSK